MQSNLFLNGTGDSSNTRKRLKYPLARAFHSWINRLPSPLGYYDHEHVYKKSDVLLIRENELQTEINIGRTLLTV